MKHYQLLDTHEVRMDEIYYANNYEEVEEQFNYIESIIPDHNVTIRNCENTKSMFEIIIERDGVDYLVKSDYYGKLTAYVDSKLQKEYSPIVGYKDKMSCTFMKLNKKRLFIALDWELDLWNSSRQRYLASQKRYKIMAKTCAEKLLFCANMIGGVIEYYKYNNGNGEEWSVFISKDGRATRSGLVYDLKYSIEGDGRVNADGLDQVYKLLKLTLKH